MASDNLIAVLADIRARLGGVPDEAWEKIIAAIQSEVGGQNVYVPASRKRSHLEIIAECGETHTMAQLSKLMGVSVRRVQQLRKLYRIE